MAEEIIPYHVRVDYDREGYEEYPLFSFYDIVANNYHDAEQAARKQFCKEVGAEMKHTTAYTFDKHKVDYKNSLIKQNQ